MLDSIASFGSGLNRDRIQSVILALFFFPLFFQLSGTIFREEQFFRSQGNLLQLPLPIASIFCFVGIALLLRLERRYFGMGFVFAFFMTMMLSTIMSTGELEEPGLARFILLIQFVLPAFALVLGNLYIAPASEYLKFEALILYILLLIIPLEVIATVIQGDVHLASYLYLFSLYQHFQYLPVVFMAFYLLVLGTFFDHPRLKYWLVFLTLWMGAYLAASVSMTAILLALAGLILFMVLLFKRHKKLYALLISILLIFSFVTYFGLNDQSNYYATKFGQDLEISNENLVAYLEIRESYFQSIEGTIVESLPRNLKERVFYWWYFAEGIFESWEAFAFGHGTRPEREIFPSAHNYYLDLAYNFGVISLIPMIYLISSTAYHSWKAFRHECLSAGSLMLVFLVAFFVFADNSLKVAFRQPYPGMMMFFCWGVLLSKLSETGVFKQRKMV